MEGGPWQATVHGVAELDVIEELAICPSELLSHFMFMYTLVGLFN